MLRKFSVRVPNNRDTVHNIPIELESDINNSNTLFRISGPYQLFTLNTDAHTHRQTMATTIHSGHYLLTTQHYTLWYKWNDKYKYQPKNSNTMLLPIRVMCDLLETMGNTFKHLSLSPSSTLPIYRMAFSIENRIDRQWIFRAKFCGLSKLKFDIHFGRWMGKRDEEWGRMGAMMLAL